MSSCIVQFRRIWCLAPLLFFISITAQTQEVKATRSGDNWQLLVNGKPFFVKGVVWAIQPPGTNFTFDLWNESEDTISRVIDYEAKLMVEAGINTVRTFSDKQPPPQWVEYLYKNYGIYTIINDLFGRYGVTVDGRWYAVTNYFEPEIRKKLLEDARRTVERYKNVPGVLMFLFGNENNYGLYWSAGGSIQDIDRWGTNSDERKARALYSLFEQAIKAAKEIDGRHPVGFINGDLGHISIISEECPSLDILGVNMYRGPRPGPSFWRDLKNSLDKPVVFGEIGCDAWNAKLDREDQYNQALYISSQWQDIYENACGNGMGNALGGCVFEWTDEWWKQDPDSFERLDIHDTGADWAEPGYSHDFVPGQKNMNEEWFGITSQGKRNYHSYFTVKHPRAAYYALQHIWSRDPWELVMENHPESGAMSDGGIASHFDMLDLGAATARGIQGAAERHPSWKISNQFTFTAMQSGDNVQKALRSDNNIFEAFPENQWGAELKTTFGGLANETLIGRLEGEVTVSLRHDMFIGEPLSSKIDRTPDQGLADRPFDLYSLWFNWKGHGAEVTGFYHYGMSDWAPSGDFFYFRPECYDQYNGDLWDNKLPIGVEAKYNFGMQGDQGITVLAGPRLYEDAIPMVIGKWFQSISQFSFSAMYAQEFATFLKETYTTEKPQAKASLWFSWKPAMGDGRGFQAQIGVMDSNWQKINEEFRVGNSIINRKRGIIRFWDTLAVKARLNYQPIQYFSAQAEFVYAGLVADSNETVPHGGGTLLFDVGRGNRIEGKGGVNGYYGNFALSLNGLYRMPLIGPIRDLSMFSMAHTNPFSVGLNREALAFETVFAFDLEPASWIWRWNAPDTEGALFAASLAARYAVYEGATDAGYYQMEDGTRAYYDRGFPGTRGNYLFSLRAFFNPWPDLRFVNVIEFSRSHPNNGLFDKDYYAGRSVITGWSENLKIRYKRLIFSGLLVFDLWGTSNTRDFNQTFPMRWSFETAFSFKSKPSLMNSYDRVGVRWNGVIRDRYSPNAHDGVDTQELVLYLDISF